MSRKAIFESTFSATKDLKEEELDLTAFYDQEPAEEEEPMNVVDGELKNDDEAEDKDYVGRYVAMCPVCAEPFFCNIEASIIEGMCHDVCPICQEEVDAQVIGVVKALDEEESTEDPENPEDDTTPTEDPEDAPEDAPEDDEDPMDEGVEKKCEKCGKHPCECKDDKSPEDKKDSEFSLEFDEATMNKIFSDFIKENYESLESLTVERVVRKPKEFTIEAKATTKKGRTKTMKFVAEDFRLGRKMKMEMKCDALNAPSKSICIEAHLKGGQVIPESMTYDYVTRILHEGKVCKAQVSGSHKA